MIFRLENFDPVPDILQGGFLAVGNFDGAHRGHRGLVRRLRKRADEAERPAIALSFDPPPMAILKPERMAVPLTTIEEKVALLHEAGAHHVGLFATGRWLLGLTAREFFDRVVVGQFRASGMVEGPTFGFGRDRGGDSEALKGWCEDAGLTFEVAERAEFDGATVSSTRIREALRAGRVSEAAALLGRPYRMTGVVTHGAGRGKGLGFPTANIEGIETLIPADGVYAGVARMESGDSVWSALHIGPNATFGAESRSVEAHLLNFEGDLYGQRIHLDLVEFVRGTRKFAGVEALLEQIEQDVQQTRKIARASEDVQPR